MLEAASEKLRLLGLTEEQIETIEKTGQPTDYITIYAPIGGIVINKHVTEGTYVQTGTKIYTIADLSQLWVQLDAYESDMTWIRYGQEVEFTTEAYPGEVFKGQISFISPTVNPRTRTIKVRLNVSNPEEKLKPDMFVRAIVRSKIASGGKVMDADMAGKWICPMHPSVVKETTGKCDICRMNLVTTESLGFLKAELPDQAPLVIPATAALITGKRAVVYVRKPNAEKPTFEGREVVLGPRAGDYYLVKTGLTEGEVVVTKGNFKIDSALQIQAKPSMMSPQGQKVPMEHHEHNH
jgi:Cu(I)/Ag(I) efflux system membrane fusion protein